MHLAYCIFFLLSLFLSDINNFASEVDQGHFKLQFEKFYFSEIYLNFVITLKANMLKYKVATSKFQHINSNECSNEWILKDAAGCSSKGRESIIPQPGKTGEGPSPDKRTVTKCDLLLQILMTRQIHDSRNRPSSSYTFSHLELERFTPTLIGNQGNISVQEAVPTVYRILTAHSFSDWFVKVLLKLIFK